MTAKQLAKLAGCSESLIYTRAEELRREGHAQKVYGGWGFEKSAVKYLRSRKRKLSAKKEE